MTTGTDHARVQTVSRETPALLQVSPETVPTAQAAVEAGAKATVLSWAPTRPSPNWPAGTTSPAGASSTDARACRQLRPSSSATWRTWWRPGARR